MSALASLQDRINGAATREELDELLRIVWADLWPRELSDADAQFLAEAIQARKPESRIASAKSVSKLNCRVVSRFAPRPCRRRLTDEERVKRRHRKRVLGSSSMMPDTMRHHFTEGVRRLQNRFVEGTGFGVVPERLVPCRCAKMKVAGSDTHGSTTNGGVGGWLNRWHKIAPRTGPTVIQGFFSRAAEFSA